jgi:hypothetical protein
MELHWFPDRPTVEKAIADDDPLLVLVAHDSSEAIIANVDDAMEHVILLRRAGRSEIDIDSFYRVVVNRSGADWTFVAPGGYRGIQGRDRRIEAFYNDGVDAIGLALKALGYDVPLRIPERYRRHWDTLKNGS